MYDDGLNTGGMKYVIWFSSLNRLNNCSSSFTWNKWSRIWSFETSYSSLRSSITT